MDSATRRPHDANTKPLGYLAGLRQEWAGRVETLPAELVVTTSREYGFRILPCSIVGLETTNHRRPFENSMFGYEFVDDEGILREELCHRCGGVGLQEDEGTAVIGVRTAGDDDLAVDQFGEPCSMCGSARVTSCGGLG